MDLASLRAMKRAGKKIVGVVVWDYQMAQIVERAGVDLVSVGDSVGVNLWGQREGEITLEEMLVEFEGTALQLPGVAFRAVLTWISD